VHQRRRAQLDKRSIIWVIDLRN